MFEFLARRSLWTVVLVVAAVMAQAQTPAGTSFTYQGRLHDAGTPATGIYDLEFNLFGDLIGGPQLGTTVTVDDQDVTDGLFVVTLDFGPGAFDGNERWLEIGVRQGGSTDTYTTLSPRQPLDAAPYALYSTTAPWAGLTGVPVGFADGVDDDGGGDITEVAAADGLTGGGSSGPVALAVDFSGSGSATTVPRSDHDHWGQSWTGSGTGLTASSSNEYGLYGRSTSLIGVHGRSDGSYGVGGYFYALGDQSGTDYSAGAMGRNDSQNTDGFGVVGHHYWSGVGVGAWSYSGNIIEGFDGDFPSGVLEFYLDQNGWGWFNGGYGTFKRLNEADPTEARALYGVQSPEVWVEDFGESRLRDGRSVVEIDPIFSQIANLARKYHVFLTPLGECKGLFVAAKTATSFEVRELGKGESEISFDYRIVAKQQGYEEQRMERLTIRVPEVEERSPEEKRNAMRGQAGAVGVGADPR